MMCPFTRTQQNLKGHSETTHRQKLTELNSYHSYNTFQSNPT